MDNRKKIKTNLRNERNGFWNGDKLLNISCLIPFRSPFQPFRGYFYLKIIQATGATLNKMLNINDKKGGAGVAGVN